jgi:transcriptional regulator with XRE-family HTH domain
MARAALGWSVDVLALQAGINRKTVLRFEQGETVLRSANLEAIRSAFEVAGIRFEGAGVFPPV